MTLLLYIGIIFFFFIALLFFTIYFLLIKINKPSKLVKYTLISLGVITFCLSLFCLLISQYKVEEIVRLDGEVVSLEEELTSPNPRINSIYIQVGFIENIGEKWLTKWLYSSKNPHFINVNKTIYSYFTENEDEQLSNNSRDESIQNIYLSVKNHLNKNYDLRIERKIEVLFTLSDKLLHTTDKLKPGDIITKIDGNHFNTVDEIDNYLLKNNPVQINIEYLRNKQYQQTDVKLNNMFKGIPSLGFWPVERKNFSKDKSLPTIMLKDGGDSAGLAIAAQIIIDEEHIKLPKDEIVVTGAIDEYGNVGKIGGIENKVTTVLNGDYHYFIVPKGNYKSAKKELAKNKKENLKIIPVTTLGETVQILKTLDQ